MISQLVPAKLLRLIMPRRGKNETCLINLRNNAWYYALPNQLVYHLPMHVGQTEISASMAEGELLVIEAE
jgi:hypothetical protein